MAYGQNTTRRGVLKGLPAAAISLPIFTETADANERQTPIMALFADWLAMRDVISATADEHEFDRLIEAHLAIESEMSALPVQCAADLAAKFMAYTELGAGCLREDAPSKRILSDMRGLLDSVLVGDAA